MAERELCQKMKVRKVRGFKDSDPSRLWGMTLRRSVCTGCINTERQTKLSSTVIKCKALVKAETIRQPKR
ncbi:hypothetical protein CEXT_110531 [Caerostris extrusa]|uniref:Uncharacterized protein n=1 Tax=Caerostris extrusa TaxID=172846 RepID=A0AAV4ST45_CAEEX|nr:hypothetical protein CEXT_110531 [Caerostris extrusa]